MLITVKKKFCLTEQIKVGLKKNSYKKVKFRTFIKTGLPPYKGKRDIKHGDKNQKILLPTPLKDNESLNL